MSRHFCSFLLFRVMGWKVDVTVPMGDKYIIALAPHTSNFDFVLGVLYSRAMDFRCDFLMKKEWFFWPLGILMRWLGGIPVYRNKKMSMTDQWHKWPGNGIIFTFALLRKALVHVRKNGKKDSIISP